MKQDEAVESGIVESEAVENGVAENRVVKVVNASNTEHYPWGEQCHGWHLLKTDAASVILEEVPPGRAEVRHYHENSRQFFFVLAGQATLELEDETFVLDPRDGLEVPPKTPHQLRNEGGDKLVFLVVSVPKSHGDRVLV